MTYVLQVAEDDDAVIDEGVIKAWHCLTTDEPPHGSRTFTDRRRGTSASRLPRDAGLLTG